MSHTMQEDDLPPEHENDETSSSPEEGISSTLSRELARMEQEVREYKDKYMRLLAESENARKRMQKERQDLTRHAVENIINEFLNPLDHFEKALRFAENGSDDVRNWAIGFEMILTQFKEALHRHGVVAYDSLGEMFDPHLHEAVEVLESSDHSPGIIIQEFVRGYKIGERPIRVARVKVAKSPETK